jgi:hypothetical protein
MKQILLYIILLIPAVPVYSQQNQLSIPRVDMMPDLPAPFFIRNWELVTYNYDSLIFDLNKAGNYLPLSRLGSPGQFNYPDNTPVFLDSYVGAAQHLQQAEAINIIPAVVGASLNGIDKSNQNGIDWVSKTKDFFNLKNNQNVYLNNYFTTSGNDWWYDIMPNIYFYQLRSLYPTTVPEFDSQFISVADRWLNAVYQLGGSTTPWTVPYMNYRAFNLASGMPLTTGVPEPEAAGGIAWLLYNAYSQTDNRKYLEGAKLSLDFLANWNSNPSYELQLPYGTLIAARLNAMEGSNYPIQKFLEWCFDRGPLRGWGAIVGKWGEYDVSGLIGEANDNGNDYAFVMNGFQQAAALAPLPKYDKRYARAIAKYILNVSNASRLFYWNALPPQQQDSYEWASSFDPTASIPYEALKEVMMGQRPFATGDAVRGGWAATNLSLYSGSSVGYLAAILEKTNIPEILQINLNKTDFYGDNSYPAFMYFNPSQTNQQVNINLPQGQFAVYEAITQSILYSAAELTVQITIPANEVRLIRLYPPEITPEQKEGRLYAGNDILDYNYNYDYTKLIGIKALSSDQNPVPVSTSFNVYCEPENISPGQSLAIEWFVNGILQNGQNQLTAEFTSPSLPSEWIITCLLRSNGQLAEDTLHVQIVDRIPSPPVLNGFQFESNFFSLNETKTITALFETDPADIQNFNWSVSSGTIVQNNGNNIIWQAPSNPGIETITLEVVNSDQLSATLTSEILIKDNLLSYQQALIWYPFDVNDRNAAQDRFHAISSGVSRTEDARGFPLLAYRFTSGQNIISTPNQEDLNFRDAISLAVWVKADEFNSERFIISHGSWQERYKLSITPEGYIRWTVKTENGTKDLDNSEPIELNRYYHISALYTGKTMELYMDGELDAFTAFSGLLLVSTKPLTIGRMDHLETQYAMRGSIDEVKIWNREIPFSQIKNLMNEWLSPDGIIPDKHNFKIYPIPASDQINIEFTNNHEIQQISLFSSDGRKVLSLPAKNQISPISLPLHNVMSGVYILKIDFKNNPPLIRKVSIR